MKNGFTRYTRGSSNNQEEYLLEIWRQPWIHWLKAYLYAKYWGLYKAPGYKAVERVIGFADAIKETFKPAKDPDFVIPWSNRQDIRLHDLKYRKREIFTTVIVSKEQFNLLKGHDE